MPADGAGSPGRDIRYHGKAARAVLFMMHERIAIDPQIMLGKPVIRGTRITVEAILRALGDGMPLEELLAAYPDITVDDVRAAQRFAADYLAHEELVHD